MNYSEKLSFNAKLSIYLFGGIMIFPIGLGAMFAPETLSNRLGLVVNNTQWLRYSGMLATAIGGYYVLAARGGVKPFILWTIPMRYIAAIYIAWMVFRGEFSSTLLWVSITDSIGATWTLVALKGFLLKKNDH